MGLNISKQKGACFPGGSDGKETTHYVGNLGSIPGSGRSPGEEKGNPLQYSFFFYGWTFLWFAIESLNIHAHKNITFCY